MAFTVPGTKITWETKLKYCEAAKRKLIEWARSNKTDIDEDKFYYLLSEIDAERVELRKETPAEFKIEAGESPSDSKYAVEIKRIRDSITTQDKDDVTLDDVSKANGGK